jgi:molybdenum cofactor cytidylyltransferase
MIAASFAGVILAAGESSRMGRDKALLPWHGQTFLSGAIDRLTPFTQLVTVVAGKNSEILKPEIYARGAFLVINPQPECGQFSSLRVGLHEVLNHGRDAAIVTLVDRPPAKPETITTLLNAFARNFERDNGKWAAIPEYEGKHGHPIVIGREMIEAFLRADPKSTARDVEHANQQHIEYVPVDDPNVIVNINTPEDYAQFAG